MKTKILFVVLIAALVVLLGAAPGFAQEPTYTLTRCWKTWPAKATSPTCWPLGEGSRRAPTGSASAAATAPVRRGCLYAPSNRNFYGRSGTEDAEVYLVSPETAAAPGATGVFTDPRDLGMDFPAVAMPDRFRVDDCMILEPAPPEKAASIEILRGPNIGSPPENGPMPGRLDGEVTIKVGDKITTDHIMPAGARMKYRSNIRRYADFVFEVLDPLFPALDFMPAFRGYPVYCKAWPAWPWVSAFS